MLISRAFSFHKYIEKMKAEIPQRMLGDIKRVLNSALKLEIETSSFYKEALEKSDGPIDIEFPSKDDLYQISSTFPSVL